MKYCYVEYTPHATSRAIIDRANPVLEEYAADGYQVTLRQLFYVFVHNNWIANTIKEYKRFGDIIDNARLGGFIDWDHIVDITRFLRKNGSDSNPKSALQVLGASYVENKWRDQDHHVEVWIEKDALAGVFERVCAAHDVGLFSCRGYTSQSEMYNAAQRLIERQEAGKEIQILHFGDHDPSGLHMTTDIEQRLAMFEVEATIHRIALNKDQIKKLKIPHNPAKSKDPRFANYTKKHGDKSWELDALEPKQLAKLTEDAILTFRNDKKWKAALAAEKINRAMLQEIGKNWDDVRDHLTRKPKREMLRVSLKALLKKLRGGQKRSALAKEIALYLGEYD